VRPGADGAQQLAHQSRQIALRFVAVQELARRGFDAQGAVDEVGVDEQRPLGQTVRHREDQRAIAAGGVARLPPKLDPAMISRIATPSKLEAAAVVYGRLLKSSLALGNGISALPTV